MRWNYKITILVFPDADLESLIEEVVRASNRGVSAAKNVSGEPNWSFGQSVFFSSTVVTTIGNSVLKIDFLLFFFNTTLIFFWKNKTSILSSLSLWPT